MGAKTQLLIIGLIAIMFGVFSSFNAYYYNNLRQDETVIDTGNSLGLMIANVILSILLFFVAVVCFYNMANEATEGKLTQNVKNFAKSSAETFSKALKIKALSKPPEEKIKTYCPNDFGISLTPIEIETIKIRNDALEHRMKVENYFNNFETMYTKLINENKAKIEALQDVQNSITAKVSSFNEKVKGVKQQPVKDGGDGKDGGKNKQYGGNQISQKYDKDLINQTVTEIDKLKPNITEPVVNEFLNTLSKKLRGQAGSNDNFNQLKNYIGLLTDMSKSLPLDSEMVGKLYSGDNKKIKTFIDWYNKDSNKNTFLVLKDNVEKLNQTKMITN